MVKVKCSWCEKELERYPSELTGNSYCCGECRIRHLSRKHNPDGYRKHPHLSEFNKNENHLRMTDEVKEKLRNARLNKGDGKSYEKTYSRHTHRIVAEQILGRELKHGEVVHHIDGNRRNNNPDNLMVFESQKEHAKWHYIENKFFSGGDAG